MADPSPWYSQGLRFQCTRCSRCCRHDSGYVFLSNRDIQLLCKHFSLSKHDFIQKYCQKVDFGFATRISLKEKDNFDCLFWEDGACSVYPVRPLQCRAYPFWSHQIATPQQWQELKDECPGVNVGPLHSREKIEEWLYKRRNEPFAGG